MMLLGLWGPWEFCNIFKKKLTLNGGGGVSITGYVSLQDRNN